MLRNYLTIAWRNLVRNKTFSIVNLLGLALGMASSLLIGLWVQDELSIGTHYPKAAQLYRVMEHEMADGHIVTDENTPGILADELKKQFPEVVYAAASSGWEEHVLTVDNKVERQTGRSVGADWLRMYGIPMVVGPTATALTSPNGIAISRKLADIYFGTPQRAIGKSIRLDNYTDYQVTAVFENLPPDAPDQYDFLLNWNAYLKREPWLNGWSNTGAGTRLLLRADADPEKVSAKLKTFLKGRNKDIGPSYNIELFLQPETEAYLYSNFKDGQRDGGRIDYVRLFIIVASFLLLIASINFMNLATARSIKRAREVGVRKVVGAERSALIGQFMGEALLLTALALVLAVALVRVVLPTFNQLTGKQLNLPLAQPSFWAMLLGLLLVMGSLAGSYPAFFLSSLNPVRVLKGSLRFGAGARLFRRGLVVFQFVLSMLMIIGTLVIYHQLQYIQTKNLGYDRQNLIQLSSNNSALGAKYGTFKERLLKMPGIKSVTFSQLNPIGNGNITEGVSWIGKDPTHTISFHSWAIGYDFVKTMGLSLRGGRDFSPAFGSDSTNYLINEAAAKRIGYKDPIGKPLTLWNMPGTIVGVVKDYHFKSLHVAIRPMVLRLQKTDHYGQVLVRTQPGQTKQALASLEQLSRQLDPNTPFTYLFVDAAYQQVYKSETIVETLASVFAGLAIFIACLGLFGLATFTAEQRIKEIGVRKVLGASVQSIVGLLSTDLLRLVFIAIVISSPLGWYTMHRWLENFAYKVSIEWWVFVVAGLLAVVIALLTISFQSIKAALMNPVKSLRSE
jgi:predicted permease